MQSGDKIVTEGQCGDFVILYCAEQSQPSAQLTFTLRRVRPLRLKP
jgi:hypothetical protein